MKYTEDRPGAPQTLIEAVGAALRKAGAVNGSVQSQPAAILWTDADRQWAPLMPRLRSLGYPVLTLGAYDPAVLQGPAIWLKCAVAGVLESVPLNPGPSIIYLPGVGRSDLRAIETCPRDLQPLAELQYRGVFWSQANGKDWTVFAYLTSKHGGLGLDISKDKATLEALGQVIEDGILLERSLDDLRGRPINVEWLRDLLAPNPNRDLLVWMNDPVVAQAQWPGARWSIFLKRCKSTFGFDPLADGILIAAEKLSQRTGAWLAVWELYQDSYKSFPQVKDLLSRVQPPHSDLFEDPDGLLGYPRVNEEAESELRYKLASCVAMSSSQARETIRRLEKQHGYRRSWLWAQMGLSPLARALDHLVILAEASEKVPSGSSPDQLAQCYENWGWRVDDAALRALAGVQAKADLEVVGSAVRALYLPWLQDTAERFQTAVKNIGGLGGSPHANGLEALPSGLCVIFVDGLRYDIAVRLKARLDSIGSTTVTAHWTSLPSVTASGKAWCSPVAGLIKGSAGDQDFEPHVESSGKPLSGHNFRKLLADHGFTPLSNDQVGDPSGRAWVECGDLDHYGHEHGVRLARDIETQLDQVIERIEELVEAGWRHFRVVTDHGWLLLPGGLPKTELPKHQVETRWGRCAVIKDSAYGTPLTFGWSWCSEVQVAFAPGVGSFVDGAVYGHGGLTLQESLVPVLHLDVARPSGANLEVVIEHVAWKGLRCIVEVVAEDGVLTVDIRTKAAQPSTSLAAKPKRLESGKANLAVKDDDLIGTAAIVVVLDEAGNVIQKASTTVGG